MPSAATATEGCRCLSGHKAWGSQISDALLSTGPTGLYLGHSESHHELALASGWHSPAEEALSSQQALRAAVVGVHRPLLATQGTLATGRTQRPACYLQTTDATGPPVLEPQSWHFTVHLELWEHNDLPLPAAQPREVVLLASSQVTSSWMSPLENKPISWHLSGTPRKTGWWAPPCSHLAGTAALAVKCGHLLPRLGSYFGICPCSTLCS
jgi:hypothetical protein